MSATAPSATTAARPVPVVCCTCNHTWKAELRPRQPTDALGCPFCRAHDVVRASQTKAVYVTVH